MMLRILIAALGAVVLLGSTAAADTAPRWTTFQRPPPLPAEDMQGTVAHDGAQIWFATFGAGSPVILLHGAGGDAGNFGFQVPALVAAGHRVIVIDSRGQGRSTHGPQPLTYELMESDVIAVMDALSVRKAAVVGWSDGAILGLLMALKNPDRETRIFAFSPNMDPSGVRADAMTQPILLKAIQWSQEDYAKIAPNPAAFNDLLGEIGKMTETQPNYTAAQVARIHGPAIAIVDGDKEELVKLDHIRYLARTIPGAQLILLKDVSHFAPLQDPDQFNRAAIAFIAGR